MYVWIAGQKNLFVDKLFNIINVANAIIEYIEKEQNCPAETYGIVKGIRDDMVKLKDGLYTANDIDFISPKRKYDSFYESFYGFDPVDVLKIFNALHEAANLPILSEDLKEQFINDLKTTKIILDDLNEKMTHIYHYDVINNPSGTKIVEMINKVNELKTIAEKIKQSLTPLNDSQTKIRTVIEKSTKLYAPFEELKESEYNFMNVFDNILKKFGNSKDDEKSAYQTFIDVWEKIYELNAMARGIDSKLKGAMIPIEEFLSKQYKKKGHPLRNDKQNVNILRFMAMRFAATRLVRLLDEPIKTMHNKMVTNLREGQTKEFIISTVKSIAKEALLYEDEKEEMLKRFNVAGTAIEFFKQGLKTAISRPQFGRSEKLNFFLMDYYYGRAMGQLEWLDGRICNKLKK